MVKAIRIPKTPKSAYGPTRKVSSLLKAHIANLEAVTHRKLGLKPARKPRTEAQASAYIAELTRHLHPEFQAAPVSEPVVAPPEPIPASPAGAPPAAPSRAPRSRKKPAPRSRKWASKAARKVSRGTLKATTSGRAGRARSGKK